MAEDIQEHLLDHPPEDISEQQFEYDEQQQILNCWGRPSSSASSLGGWRAAAFLIGANALIRLAISGCTVNFVLYLVRVLKQDSATASNMVTTWKGTIQLTSLIGGSIGDSYLGRLSASIICQGICLMGLLLFALSGGLIAANSFPLELLEEPVLHATSIHVLIFYTSLYIMGLGSASLAPNILSLGADQLDYSRTKSKFINIFMGSSNVGLLFSTTILSYWEDKGKWMLGFWISAGAGIMGFMLFLVSMPMARQFKPEKKLLSSVYKVLANAVFQGSNARCVDKGSMPQNSKEARKQETCTMDMEMQEVKNMCRLLPFWLCGILVATAISQKSTLFLLQGATMDRRLGASSFDIPPSSMSIFSLVTVLIGALTYSWVFLPCIRNTFGKDLTPVHRMGAGLILAIACFSTAALVEAHRLKVAKLGRSSLEGHLVDSYVHMSIFWLIPQYVLDGWTVVFFAFGHLEFNYISAPKDMRSFATALSLSSQALGHYISALIVHVVTSTTEWIPKNLNEGHLDYFYWLLVAMLVSTLAMYLVFAWWYCKQSLNDVVEEVTIKEAAMMKSLRYQESARQDQLLVEQLC